MEVFLVDGTYELFRHYFALPQSSNSQGQEIAAVRGVVTSVLSMIERGALYLGVATDHVIESFRNDIYPYYKTGAGIPAELLSQFSILEEAIQSLGVTVWPMVEFEADDALASAASRAALDPAVTRVIICTPDKDLSQCVVGTRVVQLDRRKEMIRDEAGVIEKFGVLPISIPDYLAVVGDTADGYPGLAGWGAKAAASVLARYRHLEHVPKSNSDWDSGIRAAGKLAASLFDNWEDALLFRQLATLREDVPVFESVNQLRWNGPDSSFEQVADRLKSPQLWKRASLAAQRVDEPNPQV